MQERYYGRVARTVYIGLLNRPEDKQVVAAINGLAQRAAESAAAHAAAELRCTLVHARIPIEEVRNFWAQVQQVARRFAQIPRGGGQVYGFTAGLYPTDAPPSPTPSGARPNDRRPPESRRHGPPSTRRRGWPGVRNSPKPTRVAANRRICRGKRERPAGHPQPRTGCSGNRSSTGWCPAGPSARGWWPPGSSGRGLLVKGQLPGPFRRTNVLLIVTLYEGLPVRCATTRYRTTPLSGGQRDHSRLLDVVRRRRPR